MGADKENSWIYRQCLELSAIQSFMEPDELGHKSHIWICNLSSLPDKFQSLLQRVI
jgi:hypothetical protein